MLHSQILASTTSVTHRFCDCWYELLRAVLKIQLGPAHACSHSGCATSLTVCRLLAAHTRVPAACEVIQDSSMTQLCDWTSVAQDVLARVFRACASGTQTFTYQQQTHLGGSRIRYAYTPAHQFRITCKAWCQAAGEAP